MTSRCERRPWLGSSPSWPLDDSAVSFVRAKSAGRPRASARLWEDPPDTTIGDGAHADGRALLLRLSAWHLWLDHPDESADDAPA